jgi:membrane-associated protein
VELLSDFLTWFSGWWKTFTTPDGLKGLIDQIGVFWIYASLFAIVFCETGLVVTPFLPGDSLLFAAGTVAAIGDLNVWGLGLLLFVAAVIGDTLNYHVGKWIGPPALSGKYRFLKKEHLDKTQAFYAKHGGKAIILARFVPIVRTFAPFVAGVGSMDYGKFLFYNVFGAFLWIVLFVGAGYIFGNLPFVRDHFSKVIMAIIVVSVLPIVWEVWKGWREARKAKKGTA